MTSACRHLLLALLIALAGCEGEGAAPADEVSDDAKGDAAVQETFVLGVNVTGENKPAFFTPLPEGADLTVEYGPQGLWMVVLAFKTRDVFTGRLHLLAEIRADGKQLGLLEMGKQKLVPGGDGWDYYYNLFLVVEGADLDGQAAEITLQVEDEAGAKVALAHPVVLRGGP